MLSSDFLQKYIKLIEDYLGRSEQLFIVVLNSNMNIIKYSRAFFKLFKSEVSIQNVNFQEFLIEESKNRFNEALISNARNIKLNFISGDSQTFSLSCVIYKTDDSILIFCEQLYLGNDKIIEEMAKMNNELANMSRELSRKNKELEDAKKKIKVLSGTLPVCSYCKKIRDAEGKWFQLESYIDKHSEAQFSHTICPVCMEREFPE